MDKKKVKKKRKILNPNLVSKKEQKEIRKMVKKGLEEYPFEQAMKDAEKKEKTKKKKPVEDLFAEQLDKDPIVIEVYRLGGIYKHTVDWQREFQGIEGRKFRFDFADEYNMVAVEIQGGVFIRGGHSTGLGITKDCEKLALALINGWKLFQFTSAQVRSGQAVEWLREYYKRNV